MAATVVRVAYSLAIAADYPAGDGQRYSLVGYTIAHGRGFADPFSDTPAGDHPPLTFVVQALSPAIVRTDAEFRGLPLWLFGQRLTMVAVGVGGVAAIAAVGRRLAGDGVGLTAAALAAVNPNLWINDGLLMAESIAAAMVGVFLLTVYRAVERSTLQRWAVVGLVGGLAALVRSESLLATVLTVVPAVYWLHRRDWRAWAARLAVAGAVTAAVCATWVVPNLLRYPEPVLFSTNDGLTLLGANCPDTYHGPGLGLWALQCVKLADADRNGRNDWIDFQQPDLDRSSPPEPSAQSQEFRRVAAEYVRDHADRLPAVVTARVARVWGVFRPGQMVEVNRAEARRAAASWAAWGWHLAVLPLSVWGLVVLRRREVPVWPLVAQGVAVTMVAALVHGLARFRIGWDVAATVATAVALTQLARSWSSRSSSSWTSRWSRSSS